jgi:hypothetical protein
MKQIVVFASYSVVVFANYLKWKNKECLASRKSGVPRDYEGSEFLSSYIKRLLKKRCSPPQADAGGLGVPPCF